ncbi:winged helix-turn-helix transcriptional regulator, partial [Blautia sp. AF19-10LB]|uniref:winged helix-turn-helix transcriptional regulator n=1 Tax=Blautia sp. AF19-10LB TaxID=2292961 RepID=UPI000E8E564C
QFISLPAEVGEFLLYIMLKKNLEGISQKVLTDSLRSMEEDGIVTRTVYPEVPPRVEYALSELGESMRPIIKSMEEWEISYKNMQ